MSRLVRLCLPAAVAVGAVAALPFAFASQDPARGQEPAAEEGPLHDAMETLDRGMKALRRAVADPEQAAANLERVRGMQAAAVSAFGLCPEPFTPMTDLEKTAWRIGFDRKMLAVADGLLQLELALVEGRYEEAKEIHSQLTGLKKEGHDGYTPPEEE